MGRAVQNGDLIEFAGREWRVLDARENTVLVIAQYVTDFRAYHDVRRGITWENCSLREYLNGDFYRSFTGEDRVRILPSVNKNADNQWYGSEGGKDTEDWIFLLSIEEAACRYFGDSSSVLNNPGTRRYKYWFNRGDEANNKKRLTNGMWWLRSPGRTNRHAAYIHGLSPGQSDSSGGCVGVNGNNITGQGGIRPALWLKL